MADHYYTENPQSRSDEWQISVRALDNTLQFTTDAGTFSRDGLDRGTEILLNALPPLSGRILDLGCGWGAVGVSLGAKYPDLDVVMTDINQRAVALARRNLAANRVSRAQVVQGDGFESVSGKFNAIMTNPPIRAGKAVIYGMFDGARRFLEDDGAIYIVIRKQQGAPSAVKYLNTIYDSVDIIDRSSGFWILCARHPHPLDDAQA